MIKHLQQRFSGPGGCAHILRLAVPLIISTGAHTIQQFVDGVFLMKSSPLEMAASMTGGIASFTIASLFLGTVTYINTFVAQYTGAQRDHRVGPAVWQGIYFALAAGLFILAFLPLAGPIFAWVKHEPAVRAHEITYFRILCIGTAPMLASAGLSCFFTGRGHTVTVMIIRVIAVALNIILDYCLIFGRFGFPRWGIAGAAWATVIASAFSALVMFVLFLRARYRTRYATLTGFRPDWEIIRRLLRFGLPSGIHFLLDMAAFSMFIVLIGRTGTLALQASTITFRINLLAFMPMVGLGIAVSTLVGQALGRDDAPLAQRSTWSAVYITFVYTGLMALGYWLCPRIFFAPFTIGSTPEQLTQFACIEPLASNLLRFVALYCVIDGIAIVISAALKGAGDTRFVMVSAVLICWGIMVLPSYLAVRYAWGPHHGLYVAWSALTLTVLALSVTFLARFLQGKWKHMRVIEAVPPIIPATIPDVPPTES